jgi:hypothetical protein
MEIGMDGHDSGRERLFIEGLQIRSKVSQEAPLSASQMKQNDVPPNHLPVAASQLEPGNTGTDAVPEARDDNGKVSNTPVEKESEPGRELGEPTREGRERGNEYEESGDYDRAGAEQDRDRLSARLNKLLEKLTELRGKSDDLDSRIDEIQQEVDHLKTKINELVGSGGGQSPGATFHTVAQLSVIEDDAFAVVEDDDSVPHGFLKKLRRLFRGIWALLWRLLSRFQVVKEWSLRGELGPVPLTGKVGVSVTFGR